MTIETALRERSDSKCELCGAGDGLEVFEVAGGPATDGVAGADAAVLICGTCRAQIDGTQDVDVNHWRCLNDSMWSQVPAVQVMAWRMLDRLRGEVWARDLLDMLFLDEDVLAWAQAGDHGRDPDGEGDETVRHLDCNGAVLNAGDTVTLIKDLNVKGAGFTAKRGTPVRGISLVPDNPKQIEGRVNGQQIVILTEFVKKAG